MGTQGDDPTLSNGADGQPDSGRRKLLTLLGAGLASAPVVGAALTPSVARAAPTDSDQALGRTPFKVRAYGALKTGGPIQAVEIQRRALQPRDVLIDILYAGICHSDIHTLNGDWGAPGLPCVPGHEIVGRVLAVGKEVGKFRVGDIAGIGCMVDSCGHCENCLADREQVCLEGPTMTYNSPDKVSGGHTLGGYSDKVVVSERFAIRIPPGIDLASTPPILCAGITTFSPFRHWRLGPGQKIAVIGLGGLGHMAVKLAVAQRAEVTVFTTTAGKINDAARLGAKEAILWSDAHNLKHQANRFDLAIATVPYPYNAQPFLDALKLDATLINIGLAEARGIDFHKLGFGRKSVSSSLIGGIAETQEVVDYCFARGIRPDIELIRPDQINQAIARVRDKDVRFRFVIDFATGKRAA